MGEGWPRRALSPGPQSSSLLASSWKSIGLSHSYEMFASLRAAAATRARQPRWSDKRRGGRRHQGCALPPAVPRLPARNPFPAPASHPRLPTAPCQLAPRAPRPRPKPGRLNGGHIPKRPSRTQNPCLPARRPCSTPSFRPRPPLLPYPPPPRSPCLWPASLDHNSRVASKKGSAQCLPFSLPPCLPARRPCSTPHPARACLCLSTRHARPAHGGPWTSTPETL